MGGKKHPLEIYRASGRPFGAPTESGRGSKESSKRGRSENSRGKANQTKKKQKSAAAKESARYRGSEKERVAVRTAKAASPKQSSRRRPNGGRGGSKSDAAKTKTNGRAQTGGPAKGRAGRVSWPRGWDGILSMRIAHWGDGRRDTGSATADFIPYRVATVPDEREHGWWCHQSQPLAAMAAAGRRADGGSSGRASIRVVGTGGK